MAGSNLARGRQPNDNANQRNAGYIVPAGPGASSDGGRQDFSTKFGGGRVVQVAAGNAIRAVPARAGAIVKVTRR